MTRYFSPATTAAIFENPQNGWRERIPHLAWLWMLLFGIFYMGARMLWGPALVTLGILFAAFLIVPSLLLSVIVIVWIVAATQAQNLIRSHYMPKGWIEIDTLDQEHSERDVM